MKARRCQLFILGTVALFTTLGTRAASLQSGSPYNQNLGSLDAANYTLRAKVEQSAPVLGTAGNTLMRRPDTDTYADGFIVDRTPVASVGVVSRWVGFAKVDPSNPAVTTGKPNPYEK